jgi:hypothetical protein
MDGSPGNTSGEAEFPKVSARFEGALRKRPMRDLVTYYTRRTYIAETVFGVFAALYMLLYFLRSWSHLSGLGFQAARVFSLCVGVLGHHQRSHVLLDKEQAEQIAGKRASKPPKEDVITRRQRARAAVKTYWDGIRRDVDDPPKPRS